MATTPATGTAPRKRALRVLATPTKGNKVYGDDVPMFWKDAAVEAGIAERTFWRLLENREIAKATIGGRVKVRPSAIRKYAEQQEEPAL